MEFCVSQVPHYKQSHRTKQAPVGTECITETMDFEQVSLGAFYLFILLAEIQFFYWFIRCSSLLSKQLKEEQTK